MGIFFGGGGPLPHFFSSRKSSIYGQIRSPPEFQLPRQTPSGRKVRGRKERRKNNANFIGHYVCPRVSTHYVRTNNAKFSGHYVCPRTQNVRAHALRSHQLLV